MGGCASEESIVSKFVLNVDSVAPLLGREVVGVRKGKNIVRVIVEYVGFDCVCLNVWVSKTSPGLLKVKD